MRTPPSPHVLEAKGYSLIDPKIQIPTKSPEPASPRALNDPQPPLPELSRWRTVSVGAGIVSTVSQRYPAFFPLLKQSDNKQKGHPREINNCWNKVFQKHTEGVVLTASEKEHQVVWLCRGTPRRGDPLHNTCPPAASVPLFWPLPFPVPVSKSAQIHTQFSKKDTLNKMYMTNLMIVTLRFF